MIRVFADAGLSVHRQAEDGMIKITSRSPGGRRAPTLDAYLDLGRRERGADVASLRPIFAPDRWW